MKLSTAIQGFRINWKQSPRTIAMYINCLNRFVVYLDDPEIQSITNAQILAWFIYLNTEYVPARFSKSNEPLSPASIDNYWISMRSFFSWTEITLKISRPDYDIQRPRYEQPIVIPYSESQIKRIIAACEYSKLAKTTGRKSFKMHRPTVDRDKAIILTLLDTGIRLGELLRLKISNVNLESEELIIQPYTTGKKSKPRVIPIGNSLKRALWLYINKNDLLANNYLFELKPSSIGSLFNRISNRTGILDIHAHRFRHTFAIEYLRNGGNIFTLKYLLGHSTLKMVNYYLQLANSDLHDGHRRASPADHWRL